MPAPRHPGHADPIADGETVLLIDRKGRRYLVALTEGGRFHFHAGIVDHDDVIGASEGVEVVASKGGRLRALRPTAEDWTLKAPRGAQVIYPKDQAMIVAFGDICPGSTVIEAGAGSGALTSALLRAVGPTGRVVSFELREDHAAVAERNVVRRFGVHPETWELIVGDAVAGIVGRRCDRLVLDLLEPWAVLAAGVDALNPGGVLVCYTPTVPQVMRLHETLSSDRRWGEAKTVETMLRGWHVDGLAVRPDHRMVAHTAFLTTARRLADPA